MKPKFLPILVAVGCLAAPALAEPVGEIAAMSGDEGSVIIVRNGQSIEVGPGEGLEPDDRVVVRGNGEATLQAFDCAKTLTAPAMVVMEAGFCDMTIVALEQGQPASMTRPQGLSGEGASASNAGGPVAAGAGVASLAALVGGIDSADAASDTPSLADGSLANGGLNTINEPAPVPDVPTNSLVDGSFDAGSGLDTGLFGFFEATSS